MNKWILLAILGFVAPAFFITGCAITGQTSSVLSDDILGCSLNTRIDFLRINDMVQACYRDSSMYFTVDNMGTSTLSGLSVYMESDYSLTMLIKQRIDPGGSSQQSLNFGSQELTGVKSLTVYPLIGETTDRIVCRNAGITIDIERC